LLKRLNSFQISVINNTPIGVLYNSYEYLSIILILDIGRQHRLIGLKKSSRRGTKNTEEMGKKRLPVAKEERMFLIIFLT